MRKLFVMILLALCLCGCSGSRQVIGTVEGPEWDIYSDAERYSESTEAYRKCLASIDRRLAKVCDTVIEVSAGQPIIHKGDLRI